MVKNKIVADRILLMRRARAYLDRKERIVENNLVHVGEARVVLDLRVDEEEDGHLDLLVRLQPLLLKAKALNLVKVEAALERVDIVGGHAGDGRVGLVLGEVKGERCVARVDLGCEKKRGRTQTPNIQSMHELIVRDASTVRLNSSEQ